MTEEKKTELVRFMRRGLGLSGSPENRWAIILIGKFGHAGIALTDYNAVEKKLPESEIEIIRRWYALGRLLEVDWWELAEISYAHRAAIVDHESYIADFEKTLANLDHIDTVRDIMGGAMTRYEASIE